MNDDQLIVRAGEVVVALEDLKEDLIGMHEAADLIRDLVQRHDELLEELEATRRELANVLGEEDGA